MNTPGQSGHGTHELATQDGRVIARCLYGPGILFRMRGLLGKSGLEAGTGIWLNPCNSIHMFFMKFSIDALFLDPNKKVVQVVRHLQPWGVVWPVKGARSCVELPAGTAGEFNIEHGQNLLIRSLSEAMGSCQDPLAL